MKNIPSRIAVGYLLLHRIITTTYSHEHCFLFLCMYPWMALVSIDLWPMPWKRSQIKIDNILKNRLMYNVANVLLQQIFFLRLMTSWVVVPIEGLSQWIQLILNSHFNHYAIYSSMTSLLTHIVTHSSRHLGPKPTSSPLNIFKSCGQLSIIPQKLDVILENKVV